MEKTMSDQNAEYVLIYVTAPDISVAELIAQSCVENRLAACANIVRGIKSIYHWKGKIETAEECIVILKTRASLFADLEMRVLTLHPYETPCVVAVPIVSGSAAFLDWITDETADPV
jgi:periplasmic divalent cation tolerance protein